jgi:molecular chaperone GrpE (heat shock protein)
LNARKMSPLKKHITEVGRVDRIVEGDSSEEESKSNSCDQTLMRDEIQIKLKKLKQKGQEQARRIIELQNRIEEVSKEMQNTKQRIYKEFEVQSNHT